jgi:ABC-type dipeptide/oligopeptide/nickel transport system permease component
VLRPDLYPGEAMVAGITGQLERAFLHFDFGVACGWPGCPKVRDMWALGYAADLWLIGGGLVLGVVGGLLGGVWCGMRPGARSARVLEGAATVVYCIPVYVIGLSLLTLFNPVFGLLHVPWFFDAEPRWASPLSSPLIWLRTFAVPWLVVAAPLAAMCLRLAVAMIREELVRDHVRTAFAKGLSTRKVVQRHAAPGSYVTTASFVGVSIPLVVINLILVERVFAVPGFFMYTWTATRHIQSGKARQDPVIDFPMMQAISVWAAVLIVVVAILVDLALARLDPRIRNPGLPG